MKKKEMLYLTQAAMIAAIYVVLLFVFKPISSGPIQIRISEALTILPYFTPAAIPGIFVGCFLGGILTGAAPIDFIFGSLTTLVAAFLSYKLRKNKFLVPIPPIVLNALIIPFVIAAAYGSEYSIPVMMVSVGFGQIVSCGILGLLLIVALDKYKSTIFRI